MAGSVAVIAALPRELAALVKGLKPEGSQPAGVTLYQSPKAVFVAAGMGASRVTLALEAALRCGQVDEVVSVGLAGACVPEVQAGTVVEPAVVVDVCTGERFEAGLSASGPILVSGPAIASVGEKAHLAEAYGASLVDMEAATLARLAQAHGLRFRALKGISDPHDFELASLSQFAGKRGEFRTTAFALHTALRPTQWRSAMELGRNSTKALETLTSRLRELLGTMPPRG